jgi:hypothetical protein
MRDVAAGKPVQGFMRAMTVDPTNTSSKTWLMWDYITDPDSPYWEDHPNFGAYSAKEVLDEQEQAASNCQAE